MQACRVTLCIPAVSGRQAVNAEPAALHACAFTLPEVLPSHAGPISQAAEWGADASD